MATNKKHLKQLLSECHWPAESSLWNMIKDKSSDFYLTTARIAIETAENAPSQDEADKQLIYAIRLLNMARTANRPNITLYIPPMEQRREIDPMFDEKGKQHQSREIDIRQQQIDEGIVSNRGD